MVTELLQQDFVQNAFMAGTIVAILTALMGYFVVLRAQAFAGEALADISFAGGTGAAVFGFSTLLGMLIFSLLCSLGMGALGERIRGRDIEIGMVLSFALGLGVLFLTIYTQTASANATAGIGILFGSILSVTRQDVFIVLMCSSSILLLLTLLFRPLLFASIDPEIAQTRGIPVQLLSIIFLVMLSVTIAESVMVAGVLLVFALLIAPAATALLVTHRPRTTLLVAIAISLGIVWGGLILGFIGTGKQLPIGFYITALAAGCYFSGLLIHRVQGRRKPRPEIQKHPACQQREEKNMRYEKIF